MLNTDQHLAGGRCRRFGKVGKFEDDASAAAISDGTERSATLNSAAAWRFLRELARARMLVGDLQHDGLAPVAPGDSLTDNVWVRQRDDLGLGATAKSEHGLLFEAALADSLGDRDLGEWALATASTAATPSTSGATAENFGPISSADGRSA